MSFLVIRSVLGAARPNLMNLTCLHKSQIRWYAAAPKRAATSAVGAAKQSSEVSSDVKPLGERVKENTKTASYMGVILLGIGVTGIMFYGIFSELFSSSSSNSVYTEALDKCVNEFRVQDALGAPIKGFGEETRRRRRNRVAHTVFQRDGVDHMRMTFYIQGIRNKGTVNLEVRKNSSGKYEYRYLFVQLDHYPHTTIILEDNRLRDTVPGPPLNSGLELKGLSS